MENKIRENIENGVYKGKLEYVPMLRLRENTVIDIDKSVRWNNEEVLRLNKKNYDAREKYRESENEGEKQFETDVIKMLTEDYPITEKIAGELFNKAYQDGHSEGFRRILEEALEIAEIFL